MLFITICVLTLLAATGINGRFLYELTIDGSIETNKIVSIWENAVAQCKSEGAILAAPISKQLRREMINLISVNNHSTPYFINAKIVHSHKPQYVSSEGVSLDDMSVSDMIDVLDPRKGDCLAMDAHSIRVVSCSMPSPYMCYKKSDTITSTTEQVIVKTTTEQDTTPCRTTDEEYKLNPITGSCYKYHAQSKNWDDANTVCTAEGGHLAVISDEEEARVIRDMGYTGAWLGLRYFNDAWTSVHGDTMDQLYNMWHHDHDPHTHLDCAILNSAVQLDNHACYMQIHFLCEKVRNININYD